MRKRIIIGLLALVVIGLGVYAVSQPRRGTLEYHKRKYLKANNVGVIEDTVMRHGPPALWHALLRRRVKQIDFHREALVEAGYFGQREFVVANRPMVLAASNGTIVVTSGDWWDKQTLSEFGDWDLVSLHEEQRTNGARLIVTGPLRIIRHLEEVVTKSNMSRGGK